MKDLDGIFSVQSNLYREVERNDDKRSGFFFPITVLITLLYPNSNTYVFYY